MIKPEYKGKESSSNLKDEFLGRPKSRDSIEGVKQSREDIKSTIGFAIKDYSPPTTQQTVPTSNHPQFQKSTFVDSYDLPSGYESTQLTLIMRDPYWIYAYWEIASQSWEDLKARIGQHKFCNSSVTLRMYDVSLIDFNGHNAHHWFDIDVGFQANNWYISMWCDNLTYCAEIGIRTAEREFFPLARSNAVTTPRSAMSGRSEMIWMEVKEKAPSSPFVYLNPHKKNGPKNTIAPLKTSQRRFYLTADDIRAYYSKLFPLLSRILLNRQRPGQEVKKQGIMPERTNPRGLIELEDSIQGSLLKGQLLRKRWLGYSEESQWEKGASEFIQPGASERLDKKRKFFFEIGTELIVYGRTEPNAKVWLGLKQIPLREDGTFTLRFALPDGKIPLDFVAQSFDKVEERRITTAVERSNTQYQP